MGLVNEKELGESIATNLGPKIEVAQDRLENWVDNLVLRLAAGYAVRMQVPLGNRAVAVTVELVPKP
jgi:hypothetical protein